MCVHACVLTGAHDYVSKNYPLDSLIYIPAIHQCNVSLGVHMHTLPESDSVAAHQVV